MKSFTRTIKQGFALIAALLFVCTTHAQFTPGDGQFVVAYTFPDGASNVQFYAQTAGGAVTYSFQVYNNGTPTSNSGSGNFTATGANTLITLNSGTLNPGDSIVIAFAPTHLRRFYNTNSNSIANMTTNTVPASAADLTDVLQWGSVHWSSMVGMFYYCTSLRNITAADMPDLTGVTDMSVMFGGASAFNGDISGWNTANITNMTMTFDGSAFNGDISGWNTAKVTTLYGTFAFDTAFNQDIGSWNTANVTNMHCVFQGASSFNQDISGWNTAKVTTMDGMFQGANSFNQDISSWNTTNVTNMSYMFNGATSFNQDLNSWSTANVTNMQGMFWEASAFNGNIDSWNTAKVTNMSSIFEGASSFNQDIGNWNTTNVTNMHGVFFGATAFNQDISRWNTAKVTAMDGMFMDATSFNQNIGSWNTANVTNMRGMFAGATVFNQNLGSWNTAKVANMNGMFENATAFNQNLGSWNLNSIPASSATAMSDMLSNSGLDCTNYSLTLQGWAANLGKTTHNGITLDAVGLSYNNDAATTTADAALVAAGWTITDNGSESCPVTTASPVTWLNFTAQKQGNTALLQWQMATESNNKGFAVQRSSDGQNWQTIGFVNSKAANGNSAQPLSYQYTDNAPLSGINYYRLQQQDLDGNIGYSSVANINFGVLQTLIHPNPASTQFTVTVGANSNFQLINVGGSIVLKGILKAGDNTINVSSLADGVYVLRVVTGNSVKTYEVLVRK